jgi:hypothetical protein
MLCTLSELIILYFILHFSKFEINLKSVREYISLLQQHTYQWSVLKTSYDLMMDVFSPKHVVEMK